MHTKFWSEFLKETDPSARPKLTQWDTIKKAFSINMVNSVDGIQCCSDTEVVGLFWRS